MKTALLFPGQAAQFVGMGAEIKESDEAARNLINRADDILGYNLSEIMFNGPEERLTETIYTQPAVFIHSLLIYYRDRNKCRPVAVAGHSLGEISACVAADVFSFEEGLTLVQKRAESMQRACDQNPGTMAAILGMEDAAVEEICNQIEGVVPANYNCPGQLVISGTKEGIEKALEQCREQGARRALEISVGGAFHSPLMLPALEDFKEAIAAVKINDARILVYQNVDAKYHIDGEEIRNNLVDQVINPVRWTASIQNMIEDGISSYVEVGGKGRILQGMLRKISREIEVVFWQEK